MHKRCHWKILRRIDLGMRKPKLSVSQQIANMESSGIKFEIVDKNAASIFLSNNTYYFKIKAFSKNYDKHQSSDGTLKYINLDFAYLKELSTIDMYLRKFIIKICLDIEHFLKVQMLNDLCLNSHEDGYNIVKKYFEIFSNVQDDVALKADKNSYCKDLVSALKEQYALWNIVEVLTFKQLIDLYLIYFSEYPNKRALGRHELYPVQKIRNAAAHNNCLLNSLKIPYSINFTPSYFVSQTISKIPTISQKVRDKKLSNPVMHDFVAMLYVLNEIASAPVKHYTMTELKEFSEKRMILHKDYFVDKNSVIVSYYEFFKKTIDYFFDASV